MDATAWSGRERRRVGAAHEQLGAGFGLGVLSLAALHVLAAALDLVLPSPGPRGIQAATAATAATGSGRSRSCTVPARSLLSWCPMRPARSCWSPGSPRRCTCS